MHCESLTTLLESTAVPFEFACKLLCYFRVVSRQENGVDLLVVESNYEIFKVSYMISEGDTFTSTALDSRASATTTKKSPT